MKKVIVFLCLVILPVYANAYRRGFDMENLKSDTGTIVWDAFRISVMNLTSFFDKLYVFPCGIGGTFDEDVWFSDFCGGISKDLTKQYKEMHYVYSNYGDKKTIIHKLTLDVPSLVINLFDDK